MIYKTFSLFIDNNHFYIYFNLFWNQQICVKDEHKRNYCCFFLNIVLRNPLEWCLRILKHKL